MKVSLKLRKGDELVIDNPGGSQTLFVFMDESGDLQFGPKAKQHFILSAVCTDRPVMLAAEMQALKYEQMVRGSEDLEFHATQNSRGTRKRVVDTLCDMQGLRTHSLWVDKAYVQPHLQDEVKLLGLFGRAMGRWVSKVPGNGYQEIVMIFDSVLTGKKQNAFKKELTPHLKGTGKRFRVLFQPVKQDLNGQIADYFSWCLFRDLESGDSVLADRLRASTHWTEFNLFRNGRTRYWEKTTTPPTGRPENPGVLISGVEPFVTPAYSTSGF